MNREYKFRAYGSFGSNKEKQMVQDWQATEYIESLGFDGGDFFEVSQYTGMKDINDKEIYEGDIVKVSPDRGKTWDTGEVVCGRFAAFSVFLRDIGTGIKSPLLNFCGSTMCAVPDIFIEVIGNIYENPELLNQEQDDN